MNIEPISREAVFKDIDSAFQQELQGHIAAINVKLKAGTFTWHVPRSNYKEKLVSEIIKRFKEKGWTVERNKDYDPRDHAEWDYLKFS